MTQQRCLRMRAVPFCARVCACVCVRAPPPSAARARTHYCRYSDFPAESEILLTPNTRLVVSRELYFDEDGFACVELTEVQGRVLMS